MEDTGERLIPELHKQSLTYGEHLARYAAAKGLVKDKVVLDIASGAGYGTALLAETAKSVTGVDYDQQAIDYAKGLYTSKNIEFKHGNAQDLPVEDASIDVVVSLETIEHIPNPEKFVKEVVRVLKPNGIFYVSTPNDDEFVEGNTFHLHEFDFKELNKLIKKYFKKADYYYQGSWYASGILSEPNFTGTTGSITSIKSFGQPTSQAIYYLAVATNGASPAKLSENIVVADRFSELNAQKQHTANMAAINDKDTRIQALETANTSLQTQASSASQELSAIKNSKGWKLLTKFYTVKSKLHR